MESEQEQSIKIQEKNIEMETSINEEENTKTETLIKGGENIETETLTKEEENNKTETLTKEEENKTETLTKEEENKTETLTKEEENKTETLTKEEENKTETLTKEEENKTETLTKEEENKTETLTKEEENIETETLTKEEEISDNLNPYAYIKRDGFTSEIFKIELRGLPKFYGIVQLKKLLNKKLNLGSSKIKRPKNNSPFIYVCFRSEKDKENAIKVLDGFQWKNSKLSAQAARPAPDPLVRKRKIEEEENVDEKDLKKPKLEDSQKQISQEERLKNSTIPLWNIPYEQQLESKQDDIEKIIASYGNSLIRINPSLTDWLTQQKEINNGNICCIEKIRSSPITEEYRNKCEFTIGINQQTTEKTVGFRLGCYANGMTGVGPIDELIHITKEMKQAAKIIQDFIRQSDWNCFNPETHDGVWKQLVIRQSFSSNDLMMILGIQSKNLNNDQLESLKKNLSDYFTEELKKSILLKSFYIQLMGAKKSGANETQNYIHLFGETHLSEIILNKKFRISPQAFFQINIPATEVLYSTIGSFFSNSTDAKENETNNTTLFDICCGTGAIGLCLADKCNQVLGLELIEEAIKDAKINAELNEITNCEYFSGRAEEILSSVASRNRNENLIAVVDPPRAGLHNKAVVALRRAEIIDKLIFVSCDTKAAMKNFLDLSRPTSKTFRGYPFLLKKVIGVDLFPNTKHYELILYFERAKKIDLERNQSESTS